MYTGVAHNNINDVAPIINVHAYPMITYALILNLWTFLFPQYGNSLPVMRSEKEILAAMRQAGLEVMEFRDLSKEGDRPW